MSLRRNTGNGAVATVKALVKVKIGDSKGIVKDDCVIIVEVFDERGFFTIRLGLAELFCWDDP